VTGVWGGGGDRAGRDQTGRLCFLWRGVTTELHLDAAVRPVTAVTKRNAYLTAQAVELLLSLSKLLSRARRKFLNTADTSPTHKHK
jgi:hypothetical protein